MHTYDELVEKIISILKTVIPPDGPEVTEESNLVSGLGLDSMKVLEILEALEDNFDISIPMNVVSEVHTVSDLAKAIQTILNK